MKKTMKIMDIMNDGDHLIFIKDLTAKRNPYKIYQVYWKDGWHRKLLTKYEDFQSVIWFLKYYYIDYAKQNVEEWLK